MTSSRKWLPQHQRWRRHAAGKAISIHLFSTRLELKIKQMDTKSQSSN